MDDREFSKLERTVKQKTQEYWEKLQNNPSFKEQYEWYIDNLLALEMTWAKEDSKRNPIERLPGPEICTDLIMLVGFSLEPLLQSVWAYEPERVYLILNQNYGDDITGEDFGQDVKGVIEQVYQKYKLEEQQKKLKIKLKEITEAPTPVFNQLQQIITEFTSTNSNTNQIIIDITGGKKSMVSEAFLYAAYANIDVSYVDSDDDAYDVTYRRPYGYRCQIGRLENPYDAFALRDWEQVRDAYEKYNFQAAKQKLQRLEENLHSSNFGDYLSQIQQGLGRLNFILDCYIKWDSGDFKEAKNKLDSRSGEEWLPQFPNAVVTLGPKWGKVEGGEIKGFPKELYDASNSLFKIYIYDEFERINRLYKHNEDFRSTFLRAAGLNEVIMVARLVSQTQKTTDKQILLNGLIGDTPTISALFRLLLLEVWRKEKGKWIKNQGRKISVGPKRSNSDIELRRLNSKIEIDIAKEMDKWWKTTRYFATDDGWSNFLNLRNKLAHTYVSVLEDVAKDAITFTEANLRNFLNVPQDTDLSDALGLYADKLSWANLCECCGLSQSLPPNLLRQSYD